MNLYIVTAHQSQHWALVYAPDYSAAHAAAPFTCATAHLLSDRPDLLKSAATEFFRGTFSAPEQVQLQRVEITFWVKPGTDPFDLLASPRTANWRITSSETITAPADYKLEDLP